MNKTFFGLIAIIVLAGCKLFSPSEYVQAEYISTNGVANPSQETKIELEDGAAIVIPANATDGEVAVTIERNPEKSKSLPPLGENVVQLGDFYNFDISGGTLIDGVDLILPFDESRIPQQDGMLVIAIPSENGWEFVPVEADGNKVTYYTSNVGDPLIAWHFSHVKDRIDLSYETKEELAVCDEHIQLEISPESGPIGTAIKITGQVLPIRRGTADWQENWDKLLKLKTAANVPVNFFFGSSYVGNGYGSKNVFDTITVNTDENGSFETTYTIDREGYGVHITAKAQCDKWFGEIPVPSEGRIYFRLEESLVAQPSSTATETPIATIIPAPIETSIPSGAVLLPDFVGQNIDDAIAWLETNGFKYTWVDGSSTYELGSVFKQAPAGGQFKVPHRTVVVLYRTIEKVENPCTTLNLTKEECANLGIHEYKKTSCSRNTVSTSTGFYHCGCSEDGYTEIFEFNFLGNDELEIGKYGVTYESDNVGINTYYYVTSYNDGVSGSKSTITFTSDGFTETSVSTSLCEDCVNGTVDEITVCENQYEYTIIK